MREKSSCIVALAVYLTFSMALSVWAVPRIINYQGNITDSEGNTLEGSYQMSFLLYAAQSSGIELWQEEQDVTITGGMYHVQLGAEEPFPSDLFDSDELYLEVVIYNTQTGLHETLSPRHRLTSTAFAIRAADADRAGDNIQADTLDIGEGNLVVRDSGQVGIGTTSPETSLHIFGSESQELRIESSDGGNSRLALRVNTSDGAIEVAENTHMKISAGMEDSMPLILEASGQSNQLYLSSGGNIGIGTSAPTEALDVVGNVAIKGDIVMKLGNIKLKDDDFVGLWDQQNPSSDGRIIFDEQGTMDEIEIMGARVGIGTASPESLLHVGSAGAPVTVDGVNDAYIYGDLEVGGIIYGNGSGITNVSGAADSDWTESGGNVYRETGNVGVGTTIPTEKLTVAGNLQATRVNAGRSGDQAFFIQATDHVSEWYVAAATIGAEVRDGADAVKRFWMECTSGDTYLFRSVGSDLHIGMKNAPDPLTPYISQMTVKENGNVGLGTANPLAKLHIDGHGDILQTKMYTSGSDVDAYTVYGLTDEDTYWMTGVDDHANKFTVAYNDSDPLAGNMPDGFLNILPDGRVGISTSDIPLGVKLAVDGKGLFEEVEVQLSQDWPDYVLAEDYALMPLTDLKDSIRETGHLPGIPSAGEVKEKGVPLGQMQASLLQKIEELTLYVIELDRQLDHMRQENSSLRQRIVRLENANGNTVEYIKGDLPQCNH